MKKITLKPSGVHFSIDDSSTILDAALKSEITLSYSCKTGSCGSCKATLLDGHVENRDPKNILSEQEVSDNVILTCCSQATSDCQILAEYFPELKNISQKVVPAKVSEIDFPKEDVAVIKLRLPPTAKFDFLAGQYLNLAYAGILRSYSIANHCTAGGGIELHIRRVVGGAMSEKIFSELAENTLVQLNGPIGTFFTRPGDRPLVFLAGGTGFAPVKAMVATLLEAGDSRPIRIYWGSHTGAGFYSELPEQWTRQHTHISYVSVVSGDDSDWSGRRGLVHQAVLEDLADIHDFDVYACGSPQMIEAARRDFAANGLPEDHFYSDAFVASNQ